MRFSTLALFFCSFCAGMVLFFISIDILSRGDREGYAVLSLDEGVPDRAAAGALERALGRPVISESSQWVLLHNFGSLERVSLEDYEGRLEAFDPRRDGYAQKLRDFFVREGRRRIFIPLDRELFGSPLALNPRRVLERRLAAALGAVSPPRGAGPVEPAGLAGPAAGRVNAGGTYDADADTGVLPAVFSPAPGFSLEMRRRGPPLGPRALLFILAWGVSFIPGRKFFAAGSRTGADRPPLLLLFPMMFPLGLWGGPGLALLAVFLLLGFLLREPLRELWVRAGAGGRGPRRPSLWGAGTYRFRIGYALLLFPLLLIIPWLGGIPAWYALANLAGLGGLYCLRVGIETRRRSPFFSAAGSAREGAGDRGHGRGAGRGHDGGGRGHGGRPRRCIPLPILSSRSSAGPLALPVPMLSFAVVSCLAFTVDFLAPGAPGRASPGGSGVVEAVEVARAAEAVGAAGGPQGPFLVREEDYQAHVNFQTNFSRRVLRSPGTLSPSAGDGYVHYAVGEDGLVAGILPGGAAGVTALPPPGGLTPGRPEIPPFPLARLSDFLAAWDSPIFPAAPGRRSLEEGPAGGKGGLVAAGAGGSLGNPLIPLGNLVIPLLVFLSAVPFMRGRGGWKKAPPMPING
jgi:hypothetical protein